MCGKRPGIDQSISIRRTSLVRCSEWLGSDYYSDRQLTHTSVQHPSPVPTYFNHALTSETDRNTTFPLDPQNVSNKIGIPWKLEIDLKVNWRRLSKNLFAFKNLEGCLRGRPNLRLSSFRSEISSRSTTNSPPGHNCLDPWQFLFNFNCQFISRKNPHFLLFNTRHLNIDKGRDIPFFLLEAKKGSGSPSLGGPSCTGNSTLRNTGIIASN